jgi:hypothetical protein
MPMKPVVFLRVAAVLTVIHAVLHTVGGVFSSVGPGPETVAVTAMKANEFMAMGNMRTFWEFYRGMGLTVSIFLTAEGIVFWLLGSLAKTDAVRLRPVLGIFVLAYLAMSVNSYLYFFSAPVIVEILIALCLVGAMVTAKATAGARERALA